jgi:hypothetical protein
MLDYDMVMLWARRLKHMPTVVWLNSHKEEYANGVFQGFRVEGLPETITYRLTVDVEVVGKLDNVETLANNIANAIQQKDEERGLMPEGDSYIESIKISEGGYSDRPTIGFPTIERTIA